MDIREIFATNLRAARKEAGLSQEELAYRADLDRTYISSLERCVYAASIDVVDGLANVLGIDPADLLRKPEGRVVHKPKSASGQKGRKARRAV